MSISASDLPVKTGDPSVDYAMPSTNNVTVENLDVTKYPQGSMVHVHNLRLSSSAPYLDDPSAEGKSTEGALVSQSGLVTPLGDFHADVKADFEGRDPYSPINYDDVNADGVIDDGDTINGLVLTEPVVEPEPVQPNPFGVTTPISVSQ